MRTLTKHGLPSDAKRCLVNDHHSALNPTYVQKVYAPTSMSELAELVKRANAKNQRIAIAGGRHAMGAQQFCTGGILLDITGLDRIISLDEKRGLVEVEAGAMWPHLINNLKTRQMNADQAWAISQKQSGCDMLTIGGALSANIHGRGLGKAPIVSDVESFEIITADGSIRRCSRTENQELFSLAIGGYGLFGIISSVKLRLVPRVTLRRAVRVCATSTVVHELEKQKLSGAIFGDFQFAIDHQSDEFLQTGILSTYSPVHEPPADYSKKLLTEAEWEELLYLAHTDKTKAFDLYKSHYLATDGQTYISDTFQLATYLNGYHKKIDARLESDCQGSEAITELYVPRESLGNFMVDAATLLRKEEADVIYGTVRLIEEDQETFLCWASKPWACIIFNLHVKHTAKEIAAIQKIFQNLYALAIAYGGKYYLTYNKFATKSQLISSYPQIRKFVSLKRKYDPAEIFQSDWYAYVTQAVD